MSAFGDLSRGTIGYFWPDFASVPDLDQALAGHVHLGPEGQLLIDVLSPLDEDLMLLGRHKGIPSAIAATTTATGALFLDVQGVNYNSTFGGFRPDTRQYRCRTVVLNAPVHLLRSLKFLSVTAFFPGIAQWAGIAGTEELPKFGNDKLLESVSIELKSGGEFTERISGGKNISLSTHWEMSGPVDRRLLYAPVSLRVAGRRPLEWPDLVKPLSATQGLLSLAFDGLVLADGGQIELDSTDDGRLKEKSTWWSARLMRQPPGAQLPKSMNDVPSFYLETLGGAAGLRRWIALSDKYPRAIGPLTSPHRFGSSSIETRLLELAAAIEYWVAIHRHRTKWAAKSPETKSPAHALAKHVGRPYQTWVGDVEEWSQRFWNNYNLLKHRPNDEYDAYELGLITAGGVVLLQCALLNRAGASTLPAQSICSSHRYYETGRQLREQLRTPK